MPAWLDKIKGGLGLAEEEPAEQTLLQQLDEATTLDRTQRVIGFATCVGIGLLLSFMAPMFIFRPTKFAAIYSMGSILSMCSTLFLMGPAKQMKRMFDGRRWPSTCIYLCALALTLVSALVFHSIFLCLVCIVVQFCAMLWYSASYIPGAQGFILRAVGLPDPDAAG
ncbi:Vesicle transport SFT2B [Micractinium conductrix]|uniref:Vesicle transport protein n=1 Tax=Micractinium conductrix TaxID=554055 RepID=A0A2P6VP74_9CHLO|nr:Vesicle transport SFT2B [Micractinium conductrix]|eukprot:PSC75903.1 Vesicle transport SFT2B [Micractinium conductrix]